MTSFCPTCATPLAQAGPLAGLCPRCVLDRAVSAPKTSVEAAAAAELEVVRELFPELAIEAEIGRGGMGLVYRARQRKLDRPVALKVVSPHLAERAAFGERFAREARAMARLAHPGIVGVHDFGERGGVYYLLMEYVDGVDLRAALRAGTVDPPAALAIVRHLCEALEYAHGQGVVHRDIKPENILLGPAGSVKVADFGLAKLGGELGGNLTRTSQVLGTPHYMAPEQVQRPLEVDHRADIYSLGVVLYEMLTGELPVGAYPPPSRRDGVDARLDRVVQRTLEREPDRRYQRASEVESDLVELAGSPAGTRGTPAVAREEPEAQEARGLEWMTRFPGGAGALSAVALALAALWTGCYFLAWIDHFDRMSGAPFTVAYPLALMALAASRLPWRSEVGATPRRILVFAGAEAVALLALLGAAADAEYQPLIVLAGVLFVLGCQPLLDRWASLGSWPHLLLALAVLLAGSILYAGAGSMLRREDHALHFFTGMLAVATASSLAVRAPTFAQHPLPRWTGGLLLRTVPLAALSALLYFNP